VSLCVVFVWMVGDCETEMDVVFAEVVFDRTEVL